MLSETERSWTTTIVAASLAVALALAGLALSGLAPGAAPLIATGLLLGSLAATAAAFTLLARRVHRLEMENMGLVEELSQEFDRVKDKLEIFGEALDNPRRLTPEEAENTPMRRVPLK